MNPESNFSVSEDELSHSGANRVSEIYRIFRSRAKPLKRGWLSLLVTQGHEGSLH